MGYLKGVTPFTEMPPCWKLLVNRCCIVVDIAGGVDNSSSDATSSADSRTSNNAPSIFPIVLTLEFD